MISGVQVDAWGAFVPNRGDMVEELKKGVVKAVKERGIGNIKITDGGLAVGGTVESLVGERREYTFFQQKLGGGTSSTLALRVAPRGVHDLELSWRLLESNPAKSAFLGLSQGATIFVGFVIGAAGVLTIPIGAGLCVLPLGLFIMGMGFGWWGFSRGKTRASTHQQLDSRALVQTVDFCLMSELERLGVSADELRVLRASQTEGVGKLGTDKK